MLESLHSVYVEMGKGYHVMVICCVDEFKNLSFEGDFVCEVHG